MRDALKFGPRTHQNSRATIQIVPTDARALLAAAWFVSGSALEGTGFESSVPRDTTKGSRGAHVASA